MDNASNLGDIRIQAAPKHGRQQHEGEEWLHHRAACQIDPMRSIQAQQATTATQWQQHQAKLIQT
jgi:hypothetical protein